MLPIAVVLTQRLGIQVLLGVAAYIERLSLRSGGEAGRGRADHGERGGGRHKRTTKS